MDELRRKLVLGMPLLSVGLFSGCGGGSDADATTAVDGRAVAQAVSSSTGQTLKVWVVSPEIFVDNIWWDTYGGGDYFVPSTSPALQAVINGSVLHLSLFEQVNLSSTVKIFKSLVVTLAVPSSGSALATNSVYPINGSANTAEVRILKRTTNSDGTITDSPYAYSSSASGTVKIASVTAVSGGNPLYKLTFSTVKFQATSGSASKPFSISGDTTLSTPTETAAWV